MALSYKSETFQNLKNELVAKTTSEKGFTREKVREYVEDKGIDFDDFSTAHKDYRAAKARGATDFRPGLPIPFTGKGTLGLVDASNVPIISPIIRLGGERIKKGLIDPIRHTYEFITPEHIENSLERGAQEVGEYVPESMKKAYSELFDPYHGDGLMGGGEEMLGHILGFISLRRGLQKGGEHAIKATKKLIKPRVRGLTTVRGGMNNLLRKIPPKTRRYTKKFLKPFKEVPLFGATFTLMEGPEEDWMTSLIEEFPETMEIFQRLAIDPDDTEAMQYLQSFVNNSAISIPFALVGGIGSTALDVRKVGRVARNLDKSTTEVISTPLSGLSKLIDAPRRWGKEWLTSRFGVHDTLLASGLKNNFAGKKALSVASGISEDLRKTIAKEAKAVGVSLTTKSPQGHKFAGETFESGYVTAALRGDRSAMNYLRRNGFKESAKQVKMMRDSLDNLSTGVIDPQLGLVTGKLAGSIGKNRKFYMNTAYRLFDDPTFEAWNSIPTDKKLGALSYLGKLGIDKLDAEFVLKSLLERSYVAQRKSNVSEFQRGIDYIAKLGKGTSRPFMRKGKVPAEIRDFMGEIKDPYKNFARTFEKLSIAKAEADFLHGVRRDLLRNNMAVEGKQLSATMRKQPGVVEEFQGGIEAARRGYVSLQKIGEERVGKIIGHAAATKRSKSGKYLAAQNPLENLFADPLYAKFIKEGFETFGPTGPVLKTLLGLKTGTQLAKTVLSPATHGRNTMGNVILMLANGYNPLTTGKESFQITAKRILGMNNKKLGEEVGRLQELGIIDSSVTAQNLRKAAGEAFNFKPGGVMQKLEKTWAGKVVRKHFQMYQTEDDFFKIMFYKKALADLKKWNLGVSDDLLENMAARQTRDLMPNYNLVPKAVKWLRRSPVSDFAAWPSEVTRVSKNIGRQTYNDVTGGTIKDLQRFARQSGEEITVSKELTAGLQGRGMQRLAGLTTAGMLGDVMQNYSMQAYGIMKDELQSIDELVPPYMRGTAKYFLSGITEDKSGHLGIDFINIGPIDPFSYLKAPARVVTSALLSGKEMNQSDWNALAMGTYDQVLGPFLNMSMITEAAINVGDVFSPDSKIREAAMGDPLSSLGKVLGMALDPFEPGWSSLIRKRALYHGLRSTGLPEGVFNTLRENVPLGRDVLPLEYYKGTKQIGEEKGRGALNPYGYTMPEIEFEGLGNYAGFVGIRPQRLDITAAMRRELLPIISNIDTATGDFTRFMHNPNLTEGSQEEIYNKYRDTQRVRHREFQKLRNLTLAYDTLFSQDHLKDTRFGGKEGSEGQELALWWGLTKGVKDALPANLWEYMELARDNVFKPSYIPERAVDVGEIYAEAPIPYEAMGRLMDKLDGQQISDDPNLWERTRDKIRGNK